MDRVDDGVPGAGRAGNQAGRRSGEGARSALEQMLQQERSRAAQAPRENGEGFGPVRPALEPLPGQPV